MNAPHTPPTPSERKAIAARRVEIETRQIAAIGEAMTRLADVRARNLKPMNETLLWAEWEAYKALREWDGDGLYDEAFDGICHALGVDEEGDELPADPLGDDYADYLYDQRKDRQLEAMAARDGVA
jgi:hypothetical protein